MFLVAHAAINVRALGGDGAFAAAVYAVRRTPGLAVLEWVGVLLPLAVHAALGAGLAMKRGPAVEPRAGPPALRTAMRVTAVASVAFLAMHLPELRFRVGIARLDPGQMQTVLAADLSTTWRGFPWRGAVYLVGAVSVVIHFVGGLWTCFATTQRGRSPRARRLSAWAAVVVAAALWLPFVGAVVFHATGARLFGPASLESTGATPCPAATSERQR